MAAVLLPFASCQTDTGSTQTQFYDAGNADISLTGAQFDQYYLIRVDTSTASHTLALPSAADIIGSASSPFVGEIFTLAVAAEGANPVHLVAGTNVTLSQYSSTVAGNTTATLYAVFDNVTSGSQSVTIY
jgi:hypothetical protein